MKQTPRKFGITLFCVFSSLGLLLLWRGVKIYYFFFAMSLLFLSFGMFLPSVLLPMQKSGEAFSAFLAKVSTKIILFILLYFVVTPIALLAKIFRKEFLDLSFAKNMKTSWIFKEKRPFDKEEYERQF